MNRAVWIPVAVVLAWFAFSVTRTRLAPTQVQSIETPSQPTSQTAVAPRVIASSAKPVAVKNQRPIKAFEYARELNTYLELKTKLFPTPEEKTVRAALLSDSSLMRALGRRLTEPSSSPVLTAEQEAGIDLLLEAFKQGDRATAGEVLRGVVADQQVENASLDRSVREQLAGVKAEVLYHWSAAAPHLARDMQAWLPGPVSQAIWSNVANQQHANLDESRAEAATP